MGNGARPHPEQEMSRRLIIRPEAENEMADAYDRYEGLVPGLGADFLLCVEAVFHAAVRGPQHYPRVHGSARRALARRFPYEVFFVEDDERVVILSVFHARRNPRQWQERI